MEQGEPVHGWTDVDLSEKGLQEAQSAGQKLKAEGYMFDLAFTSVLKRAVRTLWIMLDEMDLMWIPVLNSWRLNERHYGGLQGLNKAETAAKFGEEQVHIWRRSYDVPPPKLEPQRSRATRRTTPATRTLAPKDLPLTECLKDTVARALPYWHDAIAPALKKGKKVIIAAHGNSIRALVKMLDSISDKDIAGLDIPTGIPLIYELDDNLAPIRHYYLADEAELQKAVASVKSQGKAK